MDEMDTINAGRMQPEASRGLLGRPTSSRKAGETADPLEIMTATGLMPSGEARRNWRHKKFSTSQFVRLATWNVGSMSKRYGEIVEVLKKRRVDVCCVQETRWKGGSARWFGAQNSRYKFFWQGCETGVSGVGVLVAEKWVDKVICVKRVNERIMVIKLLVGRRLTNIVSAYAPQCGRGDAEKDAFWDRMYQVVGEIPMSEAVYLGGDLNGHVGKDADGFDAIHGGFGHGIRNTEGENILIFGAAMMLAVCNTFFCKAENHLVTYASGSCKSQIDFVMVRVCDRKHVKDVKVIAGEECVSQHRLVVADLQVNHCPRASKKFLPKLKMWELRKESKRVHFEHLVSCDDVKVLQAPTVDTQWTEMKESWMHAARTVCGVTKGPARHHVTWWWCDEVEQAVEEKKMCFKRWFKTRKTSDRERYLEAKRNARRAVWNAKVRERLKAAQELASERGRRRFFGIAKNMVKENRDITAVTCVRNRDGNIVVEGSGVLKVWKDYMEEVMNVESVCHGISDASPVEGPGCEVSASEVANAIQACDHNKAAGPSGVSNDMLLASGATSVRWLTLLCNGILSENMIPSDWTKSVLVPLYKGKGDPLECGSYRGLKLTEVALKVYERVLAMRIRSQVDINAMQFGFMPGRGTTDAIFIVRQLQEKFLAKKRDLYFAFLDLEKAFDRVPRAVVTWALRKSGVEEWLVRAVMTLYHGSSTSVRFGSGLSEAFSVSTGLHQGSVLSPLLFAIVMNAATAETTGGLPFELLYADDIVLLAESKAALQQKLLAWKTCLLEKGMTVNASKTKVMLSTLRSVATSTIKPRFPCSVCTRGVGSNSIRCTGCRLWTHKRCTGVSGSLRAVVTTFLCKRCKGEVIETRADEELKEVLVMNDIYEAVNRFCYLGDMLDASGGCEAAVSTRIKCGWKKFRELVPFLISKATPLWMKGQVFDACVRSCMLYGSETWAMKVEDLRRLITSERRMVRWMLGVALKDRISSRDLLQRLRLDDIADIARRGRLRWFGHVVRRADDEWVKRVTTLELDGPTPRGRPRKTWKETVLTDCRSLGLREEDARNREEWRLSIRRNRPTQNDLENGR